MILVMRLLPPLKQLSQVPTTAQQSLAAAERLFEVLDEPTEDAARPRHARRWPRSRDVDRVRAASASPTATSRCCATCRFAARRGEVVALVGASGAGKSTLVDLIPRFYEPTAGASCSTASTRARSGSTSLRALTGIVSQDTVLFNDTVRSNIAYGAGGRFTDEQIEAAARAANAHGFIAELPAGLRHRARRARHAALRRAAPAARHRARAAHRPADPHPRRGDVGARHRDRAAGAGGDRPAARRPHGVRHRAPALDGRARRPDPRARARRIVERGTHAELLALRGAYHRLHALQFAATRASRPIRRR